VLSFTVSRISGFATLAASVATALGLLALVAPDSESRPGMQHTLAPPHHAPAADLHVATWGKDWWPGTRGRPFATIGRAQEAVRGRTARMRRDIVVNIHSGTYRLPAPIELSAQAGDSGQNGHRVVYQAASYGTRHQADVTVSGGRKISGWTRVNGSGGMWRADVGSLDTRQLYVNGQRAKRTALGAGLPGTLSSTDEGYVTDSTVPQTWANPQDIELVFRAFPWSEQICGVAGITGDANSTTITMDQPCFRSARTYRRNTGRGELPNPVSVQNSLSFLTEPGSFYLDRSEPGDHVLYYIPRAGEGMRHAKVVAPVLEKLIDGSGTLEDPVKDITFRGIEFAHATWLAPGTPRGFLHFIWSGYENGDPTGKDPFIMGDATHVPGSISFRHAEGIVFEDNHFTHLGGVGLEFSTGSSENVIRGNEINDISQTGITVGELQADSEGLPEGVNRENRIENNWIHGIGVEYHGGGGMFLYKTQDTLVAHNQVNDIAYSGISTAGAYLVPDLNSRGAKILNNLVFDWMNETSDGGGIYMSGPQGSSQETGAVVNGNVIYDGLGQPNIGIYTDEGSNWVAVSSNVVYGTQFVFGGCSTDASPIQNISIDGNYSDTENHIWGCATGEPFPVLNHSVLGTTDPAGACQANAGCAAIVANAGLEPPYRHLLD
jgi:hypothetical protein